MADGRAIFRAFKNKGLSLSAEASKALVSVLSKEADKDGSLGVILDAINERIEKREIRTSVIDVGIVTGEFFKWLLKYFLSIDNFSIIL